MARREPVQVRAVADPEDELVNGDGLIRLAASQKGWTFESLSVEGSTLPKAYHHLVIDSAALGKQEWARVLKLALSFLGGK